MENKKKERLYNLKQRMILFFILTIIMVVSLGYGAFVYMGEGIPFGENLINSSIMVIGMLAGVVLVLLLYKVYREVAPSLDILYQGMEQVAMDSGEEIALLKEKEDNNLSSQGRKIVATSPYFITLIENINNNESFPEIVKYIYSSFSTFIPYHYIGIALIEDEGRSVKAYHGISDHTIKGLPDNLFGYKVPLNKTSLGQIINSGRARIINDLEEHVKGRPYTPYNEILLEAGVRSSITLPLRINQRPVGFIFFSSNKKNVYNEEHIQFLKILTNSISLSLEKNKLMNDLIYSNILSLANLAESRDHTTGDHLYRMKNYSRLVAEALYKGGAYKDTIDLDYIEDIERFSPLHDIGKVAIRDDILLKPGRLSKEEFEIMKQHTLYGAKVLKEAEKNMMKNGRSIFSMAIDIAEGHHEKWDGSGYPLGKKGEDIPLSARIVAVGDVFDALTSQRPYKRAFSFEEAFGALVDGKGAHFDPQIIQALEERKESLYKLYHKVKE